MVSEQDVKRTLGVVSRRRRSVRWVAGLVVLAAGTGAAGAVLRNRSRQPAVRFQTVQASRETLTITATATGNLESLTQVKVGTEIAVSVAESAGRSRTKRWWPSVSRDASITHPASCREGNCSVWPSRGRIVASPSLLFADEPTGNLDTARSQEVLQLLVRFNRERALTIVMVTHESDIAAHAQRTIRFRDGHIESDSRTTIH